MDEKQETQWENLGAPVASMERRMHIFKKPFTELKKRASVPNGKKQHGGANRAMVLVTELDSTAASSIFPCRKLESPAFSSTTAQLPESQASVLATLVIFRIRTTTKRAVGSLQNTNVGEGNTFIRPLKRWGWGLLFDTLAVGQ